MRVVVLGGGPAGMSAALHAHELGAEVTLIEAAPRLIADSDEDVSEALARSFRGRGIAVLVSTLVERLERGSGGITAHHRSGARLTQIDADAVFFAVGWPGNADGIDATKIGIDVDRGYVKVGDDLRSSLPHIFAAGDVNGISMLVPSARLEGRVAAENAVLGTRRRFMHELVPTASFTDPEYGGVGLIESQARERYDCAVAVTPYENLVRPVIDDHPDGFCKAIVECNRRYVLGAPVVGEYSAEVIQTASACMAANLRIEQIAELQPAFPTFTEGITTAAQTIVRQMGIAPARPPGANYEPPKAR